MYAVTKFFRKSDTLLKHLRHKKVHFKAKEMPESLVFHCIDAAKDGRSKRWPSSLITRKEWTFSYAAGR